MFILLINRGTTVVAAGDGDDDVVISPHIMQILSGDLRPYYRWVASMQVDEMFLSPLFTGIKCIVVYGIRFGIIRSPDDDPPRESLSQLSLNHVLLEAFPATVCIYKACIQYVDD